MTESIKLAQALATLQWQPRGLWIESCREAWEGGVAQCVLMGLAATAVTELCRQPYALPLGPKDGWEKLQQLRSPRGDGGWEGRWGRGFGWSRIIRSSVYKTAGISELSYCICLRVSLTSVMRKDNSYYLGSALTGASLQSNMKTWPAHKSRIRYFQLHHNGWWKVRLSDSETLPDLINLHDLRKWTLLGWTQPPSYYYGKRNFSHCSLGKPNMVFMQQCSARIRTQNFQLKIRSWKNWYST